MSKFIGSILCLLLSIFILSSCEDNIVSSSEEQVTPLVEQEGSSERITTTACDVDGPRVVRCPGEINYTYTSNRTMNNIVWSVVSGNITLISANGSTATFSFGSNFSGGSIKASGNGSENCEKLVSITKARGCGDGGIGIGIGIGGGGLPVPSSINVIAECNTINVRVSPVTGATGYRYYVDGVLFLDCPSNDVNIYNPILQNTPSYMHEFCVEAYNATSQSSEICMDKRAAGDGQGDCLLYSTSGPPYLCD